jgi:hypothetical protein
MPDFFCGFGEEHCNIKFNGYPTGWNLFLSMADGRTKGQAAKHCEFKSHFKKLCERASKFMFSGGMDLVFRALFV